MSNKRVLIAYATRYGSTRFVVDDIEQYLTNLEVETIIIDLNETKKKNIPDLDEFDLIIIGASVAMFMWARKAKKFLKNLKKTNTPYGIFVCCGTAIEERDKAQEKYIDKYMKRRNLNPLFSQPICPCIDFRPGSELSQKKKKRIKETIKAVAKEQYKENGLMDLRDEENFNGFLEKIGKAIA